MNKNYIGYARVSTAQQNEDRQLIALREYGVPPDAIFTDRQSGKDFNRKNYKCMLKKLKKGKVLVVKSIDRLGRNYDEIIEQWQYITKEIGADTQKTGESINAFMIRAVQETMVSDSTKRSTD